MIQVPFLSQSTPELTRNMVTSYPEAMPPLATLHATEDRSSLKPLVTITTSFLDSLISLFLLLLVKN